MSSQIPYSNDEILYQSHPYVILDRALHSGAGNNSKICTAYHLIDKQFYAVKRIIKYMLNNDQWDNLHRGIAIHKSLSSIGYSGVVRLVDVIEDVQCYYMVMELMDDDLVTFLQRRRSVEEEEARMIFKKTVDIVNFIHSHDIAHRDLKLDNFLIRWDPQNAKVDEVKLTDFDFSDYLTSQPFNVPCGSPAYTAPEICTIDPLYYGRKTDVWSLGVLLYTLLCGYFPWYDEDIMLLFEKIHSEPLRLPSYLSSEVKDLLQKLLNKDPDQRITVPQILTHSWMQKK